MNFNYSTTDSTEFFPSTETTTQLPINKDTFTWTNAEINRLIQIIVRPILLVIGSTGNGLTFYIMRRTSLKDVSSCFYMCLLALADTSKSTFSISCQH